MAKTHSLNPSDEPEEFDEFLLHEERPGIADRIEWLFANSFRLLLMLLMPWTWFRGSELESDDPEFSTGGRGHSLVWRTMNGFEQVSFWTGNVFTVVVDSIELFFINVFTMVRRLLRLR